MSKLTLSQAYILGGSPCSGKSTIAARLAREYSFPYYKVDDHERAHARRVQPDRHPVMHRYSQMTWDQIWMRPVAEQVDEEFAYYRERFEMILEDLTGFNTNAPFVLEGAAYLPALLDSAGAVPGRVLFMVPARSFQIRHYQERPWIQPILHTCADPERAFANWMARDHAFGQQILQRAEARGYHTLIIDGGLSLDQTYQKVRTLFSL